MCRVLHLDLLPTLRRMPELGVPKFLKVTQKTCLKRVLDVKSNIKLPHDQLNLNTLRKSVFVCAHVHYMHTRVLHFWCHWRGLQNSSLSARPTRMSIDWFFTSHTVWPRVCQALVSWIVFCLLVACKTSLSTTSKTKSATNEHAKMYPNRTRALCRFRICGWRRAGFPQSQVTVTNGYFAGKSSLILKVINQNTCKVSTEGTQTCPNWSHGQSYQSPSNQGRPQHLKNQFLSKIHCLKSIRMHINTVSLRTRNFEGKVLHLSL